jgi:hypothetical protein
MFKKYELKGFVRADKPNPTHFIKTNALVPP